MNVGIVDVDGHNFPNLALMRISAFHKTRGDRVSWWWGWDYYDVVYMSKVFSFSPDVDDPVNTDAIIRGGTGYCIKRHEGREVFDQSINHSLPAEIESAKPDYSIYPQYDFAVAMTTRGCPRSCPFCHVSAKEGRASVKVADVADFYNGQRHIEVLDPNITACPVKTELFRQYKETNATISFNQGLDIRLITNDDIELLNEMKLANVHFAWDNAREDLKTYFEEWAKSFKRKTHRGTVYVLTNYDSTMSENLYRIYTLRDLGYDPFVMIYDKENAPREIRRLQRWCNNKYVFKSTPKFEDYI